MENGVTSLFSLAFAYQVKLFGEVAKPLRVISCDWSKFYLQLSTIDSGINQQKNKYFKLQWETNSLAQLPVIQ